MAAGVTPEKALETLGRQDSASLKPQDIGLAQAYRRAQKQVGRGVPLSKALGKQGCVHRADIAWLAVAEQSGRVPEALKAIASRRATNASLVGALRAGLAMPVIVMLIGAFAALFVNLVQGQSLVSGLFAVLWPCLGVWLAIKLFIFLISHDARLALEKLWSLPIISDFLKRHNSLFQLHFETAFYRPLLWQFDAGVPFVGALENVGLILKNRQFERQTKLAGKLVGEGNSIDVALSSAGLVLSKRLLQSVQVGQQSGRIEQAIKHEIKLQEQALNLRLKSMVSWAPKIVYLLVLVIVSSLFI